ncbi:NUDE protein [Xylaria sp. CBS 124048]|nr:NUDE protein [Xylaria sp. CBS 124048]
MAEPPSSPPNADTSPEKSLAWYKKQYEQLCDELSEFRESSHELEAELEKDLDNADKRERALERKTEALQFEVDEWKEKYKKAKAESNSAQTALEKEITSLRDNNRTIQLKLRDIEVANDDFERQARNTTSSLEDLESKYNVAIERTVLLEEEIKIGEQERETLRIENQRLREELSDAKIEADIMQDKVKKAEHRHLSTISTDISIPDSDTFEDSPQSTASSPMITTPPNELSLPSTNKLPSHEPPSPPMSDASAPPPRSSTKLLKTPASSQKHSRIPSTQRSTTPKPRNPASASARQPNMRSVTNTRAPAPPRTTANHATAHKIPPSTSLTHIRSLTAQMQRLEARVQSARSRLPAPAETPPHSSPGLLAHGGPNVPSSITMRPRKRTGTSVASSVGEETPMQPPSIPRPGTGKHIPRLSGSSVPRLSFGPLPHRTNNYDESSVTGISRPSSRASVSSYARPDRPPSRNEIPRPRTSLSGARVPVGLRPRSSMSGNFIGTRQSQGNLEFDEMEERTPSRRGTYSKYSTDGGGSGSGIPTPTGIPLPRRQSIDTKSYGRRTSGNSVYDGGKSKKLSDLGETY